jgi:hypothetical protein
LHAAPGCTGASFANERCQIGRISIAQSRGNAKEVLGTRELKTFYRVTLVQPRLRDDIG